MANEKSDAEINYVRMKLKAKIETDKISQRKCAEMIGRNHSNVSRFLSGNAKLDDEAIEKVYALDLVARPSDDDLESVPAPETAKQVEYRRIEDLREHPINATIYGDGADQDLVASIEQYGVLTPLLITGNNIVVSGHRRLDGARKAGLDEVPVTIYKGDDSDLALESVLIEANRQRKKTNEQIANEYKRLKEIETIKAKGRMATGEKQGKSADIAAKKLGLGSQKAERALKVVEEIEDLENNGENEKAQELRQALNTKSVNAAHKMLETKKKNDFRNGNDTSAVVWCVPDESEGSMNSSYRENDAQVEDEHDEFLKIYCDEIEKLKAENEALRAENAALKEENEKLSMMLDEYEDLLPVEFEDRRCV